MHKLISKQKTIFGSKSKLNWNSDAVDLELLEKYNWAQFLGQRLRVVNRHWKNLIDKDNHYKLQEAIMKAISNNIKKSYLATSKIHYHCHHHFLFLLHCLVLILKFLQKLLMFNLRLQQLIFLHQNSMLRHISKRFITIWLWCIFQCLQFKKMFIPSFCCFRNIFVCLFSCLTPCSNIAACQSKRVGCFALGFKFSSFCIFLLYHVQYGASCYCHLRSHSRCQTPMCSNQHQPKNHLE